SPPPSHEVNCQPAPDHSARRATAPIRPSSVHSPLHAAIVDSVQSTLTSIFILHSILVTIAATCERRQFTVDRRVNPVAGSNIQARPWGSLSHRTRHWSRRFAGSNTPGP